LISLKETISTIRLICKIKKCESLIKIEEIAGKAEIIRAETIVIISKLNDWFQIQIF
jgi:hypothetical protein